MQPLQSRLSRVLRAALAILPIIGVVVAMVAGVRFTKSLDRHWNGLDVRRSRMRLSIPAGASVFGIMDFAHRNRNDAQVATGSDVQVQGWAVSTVVASPVQKIQIFVDNERREEVTALFLRPDIAEAYRHPEFERSGWSTIVSLRHVPPGKHSIGALAITTDGRKANLPPLELTVK